MPFSTESVAHVESWQLSLHDKSPITRKNYLASLSLFAKWLAAEGRTTDLLAITRKDCEAWFSHMTERGLSDSTRRSRWIALRSFYSWLLEEEEIPSPMAKVKVARPDEPPPDILPVDDIRRLLKACQGRGFDSRRDAALVRTFLATGARLGEVTAMRLDDFDLPARLVVIQRGKGGRRRIARFDGLTATTLDRYRRARARHRYANAPAFWVGRKGPLTSDGIDRALRRRAAAAAVEGFHPHRLRHTWADLWKAKGGNEEDLMQLGGWTSFTVMRRYGASRAVDRALNAYDAVNPLDGL